MARTIYRIRLDFKPGMLQVRGLSENRRGTAYTVRSVKVATGDDPRTLGEKGLGPPILDVLGKS